MTPEGQATGPDVLPDDVETELAAALPQTQGSRFLPMLRGLILRLVGVLLLGAAALVLWREFREIRPDEVLRAMTAWGWRISALAVLFSALSFLLMGVVEWIGLRWAGARVSLPAATAGFIIASGIAHSLGSTLIVSGAIRARIYARYGVSLRQVAATTLFQAVAFTLGLSSVAGVSLLLAGSQEITDATGLAGPLADGLGFILLGAVAAYLALCALVHRPVRAFGHSVRLPSLRMALTQLGLGAIDSAMAAAIIWILLPPGAVGYFTFAGAYAPSVVAGLISHVPGGVGVFEGSLSALLGGLPAAPLAAAFLGYRLFFFVLPLLVASLGLALVTLRRNPPHGM